MQFLRYIFLFVLICFLQACSYARVSEQLQLGRVSFDQGNFIVAFQQLMPLAYEGNPPAQYAVGYMYFYGYGVPQDDESGLFWISKAARKGYPPAIRALTIVQAKSAEVQAGVQEEGELLQVKNKSSEISAPADVMPKNPILQAKNKQNDLNFQSENNQNDTFSPSARKQNDLISQSESEQNNLISQSKNKQNDIISQSESKHQDEITQAKNLVAQLTEDNSEEVVDLSDAASTKYEVSESHQQSSPKVQARSHKIDALDDEVLLSLEQLPTRKKIAKGMKSAFNNSTTTSFKQENNASVEQDAGGKYTLQLLGGYHLNEIKKAQAELNLKNKTYIGHTQHNGRDWYVLSYGRYRAMYQAKLALDDLPTELKSFKPWVRNIETVRIIV